MSAKSARSYTLLSIAAAIVTIVLKFGAYSGHTLCEEIELAIVQALPGSNVIVHVEPKEDPASWSDRDLDRL